MRDPSEIRSLPIDIAFARLQEWLVDRKRVPHDWRKRLAALRARLAAAFASLPRDLRPDLLTLELEVTGTSEHEPMNFLSKQPKKRPAEGSPGRTGRCTQVFLSKGLHMDRL